jgi:hypothetical protein
MAIQATIDNGRVLYAFRKAPAIFADDIDHWFNKERLSFLGAKKNATSGIKGKLLHKEQWGRGDGWSPSIVGQFVSHKTYAGKLDASMTMGFAPGSPMEDAMELLEKGGTSTSNKFMPIPVWDNLKESGMIMNQSYHTNTQESASNIFKEMSAADSLFAVHGKNGNIYWLSKVFGNAREGFKPLLLFVGKKTIKIKKQFDFHKAWTKRYPKVMRRGEMAIFRATRKVESLMNQGKII